jgi:hypothetical protein
MKMRYLLPAALTLAMPVSVSWAQHALDTDKLPKVECSDLHFSKAFLAKYPKAPQACLEARVYKGQKFGKFTAKVYLNSKDRTTVTLVDANGNDVDTFSIKPGPESSVMMQDHEVKFHDLQKGEKITFWLSEKRMSAQEMPGSTKDRWAVAPPAKE